MAYYKENQKVFKMDDGVTYYGFMGKITRSQPTICKKASSIGKTELKVRAKKGVAK